MTSNDEHAQQTPADDDVDVVVINPAELMPAEDALRNYDIADDALGRFVQLASEGWHHADAAARAIAASGDETGLAADTIAEYQRRRDGGNVHHDVAYHEAVVAVADRYTPRVSAETAQQIAAAFADEPAHGDLDYEADEATARGAELDVAGPGPDAADERNPIRVGGLIIQRFEQLAALSDEDTAAETTVVEFPAHRGLAQAIVDQQLRQRRRSRFDRDQAALEQPAGVADEVGEDDVSDAAWRFDPPADAGVPEREPAADSWIARNLSDAAGGAVAAPPAFDAAAEAAERARVRDAVNALPAGAVSDADLKQVGITRDEFNRVIREQAARVRAEDQAQFDAERERARRLAAEPSARAAEHAAAERLDADSSEPDVAAGAADAVLGRIDAVLAEDDSEPPLLSVRVAESGQAVTAAEHAVAQAGVVGEDSARAERCARWNAEDQAAEASDDQGDGWELR